MTWPTHAAAGVASLWLLAIVPPEWLGYDLGVLSACAALGALLPDLDASESKIKHLRLLGTNIEPFYLPSWLVHATDQHRGLLHSLAGLAFIATCLLPALPWIGWAPVVATLLGYGSHLLADSATKSGSRFFYPRPNRFYLLPPGWRMTTGSQAKEICFVVLAMLGLPLLFMQISGWTA